MRRVLCALTLSAAMMPALATDTAPPASAPTPATTAETPAPATEPAAATPSAATPAPAAPTASATAPAAVPPSDKPPFKVPPEYRRKIINGKVSYCTQTTTLGSRFPKTICVDEDGLRELVELRRTNQDDLRRAQSACTSSASCGGS